MLQMPKLETFYTNSRYPVATGSVHESTIIAIIAKQVNLCTRGGEECSIRTDERQA